ncbi:MAG: hypothetical protein WCF30_15035 [Terracidiphilus sp.]
MKIIMMLALAGLVGLGSGTPGFSQGVAVVQFAKPFKAQTLAGFVRLGSTEVAAGGVLVEECTGDWKVVKSSTKTDEVGHFSLPGTSSKGLHYLRLSGNGFDPTLIKVIVSKTAHDKELALKITVAT